MIEYIQCRRCLGKNGPYPKGFIAKRVDSPDGKHKIDVVEECECHKTWKKAVQLEDKVKKAGLSPDILHSHYSPDSYVGTKSLDNVSRIKRFVERSLNKDEPEQVKAQLAASSIYMYGPNGTQKTSLAMWMGYKFLEAGKTVKYILMNDLLKMLQKAERDDQIKKDLDKIAEVDLLLIDESFDKGKLTIYKSGYQIPFLDSFLRNRLQSNSKGIVFISNVSMDEIEKNSFNESIQDLVTRNVTIYNGFMEFKDNYLDTVGQVDIENLF